MAITLQPVILGEFWAQNIYTEQVQLLLSIPQEACQEVQKEKKQKVAKNIGSSTKGKFKIRIHLLEIWCTSGFISYVYTFKKKKKAEKVESQHNCLKVPG